MPLSRARSPDALYDAVADQDLVIVPDAPLASALNRRIDRPEFGTFATTPRRLAAGRRETAEDRTAFLDVIERTDHDWKSVSYAVGNVLQCWEHEGDREAILEFDAYADEVTRDVVEILGEVRTTAGQLATNSIDADRSVAVIGEGQLTELERSILPASYDAIDLFTEASFDLPRFEIFESSAAIVDAILDTVDAERAGDVAIVLDASSRYSALVESALEAADVPFYGGPGFLDRPHHRTFLAICRAAVRGDATTVADVRPILQRLDADVPVAHDEKRLPAVDHPTVAWLRDFFAALEDRTFTEAIDAYAARATPADALDALREELATLGLANRAVTQARVDRLAYYLQRYDVPVDRENEGVLLADATAAGYVDRPAVFHVGLDEGWTHSAPQRPWVDGDAQFERSIRQFQLLLQSGVEQYFLVQDTDGGEPVTPCLYFGALLDAEFDRFADLDSVAHTRPPGGFGGWSASANKSAGSSTETSASTDASTTAGGASVDDPAGAPDEAATGSRDPAPSSDDRTADDGAARDAEHTATDATDGAGERAPAQTGSPRHGFDREPLDVAPERVETISNSSLTTHVNCPRDYLFDRLLDAPDRDYFTEGNLFHDFAEYYVDHPDSVDDAAIEAVVDLLLAETGAFYTETERPLRRRSYRLGLETIVEFLDERGPESDDFLTPTSGWGSNRVAEHFGESVDSPLTERWFEDADLGTKGKIDLVRAPDHLLDYKSGSKQSARTVVERAAVDPPADTPEFQAALYLSYYRSQRPDEHLTFTFFHFLETLPDLIRGEHDLDDALTTVEYYPHTFETHAASRAAYDELLDGYSDCVATMEALGFDAYHEIVGELSVPETTDRDELRESEFAAAFTAAVEERTAPSAAFDAAKGCDQAIRLLASIRATTFFREDLDAVEAFVADRIDALNDQRAGDERFSIDGPGGEPNYRRVDHRDLLLEGER